MTDVLAALAVLSSIDCPERVAALAAFHAAWHDDALVLDKWFAIQATSKLPGTLEAVRALSRHPDYDLRNPNRIRALVGSFAGGNPVRFHDASGGGYRFLPIRSSRSTRPTARWRRGWSRRWVSGAASMPRARR
jgi:aminopeptidase N